MKIAITQRQTEINGFVHDCLDPNWYKLFKGHELIIIPNLIDIDLDIDLDMLVISGGNHTEARYKTCLLYTSPSPRDRQKSRMPSSA